MKYTLREISMAEPKGFSEGSGSILLYIPTQIIIQTYLGG